MLLNTIENTFFVGKFVYFYEELPSTNEEAVRMLSENTRLADGTMVVTYQQTAGRGQMGTSWLSEPNENIAMSVIFFPHFLPIHHQFDLNKAISLALAETVEQVLENEKVRVKIKWSNDIFLNDQKTAGILIQNTLTNNHISASVVGIGLNVNQTLFSDDLPHATSLNLVSPQRYSLTSIVKKLAKNIEIRYLQLKNQKYDLLHEDYLHRLYRKGEITLFERTHDHTFFQGTIQTVNERGELLILNLETKKTEIFNLKEVRIK